MEDISSLFNYRDPRSMRADQYSAQMQAPSGDLDQMTVQLGGNAGSLIGNALFGGQTSKMAEQSVLNEAIKESEVATDPDERLSLFSQALRKRGLEGYAQKVDAQLQGRMKAKTDAQNAQQKQMALTRLIMDKTGLDSNQAAALAQDPAAVREIMKDETAITDADGRVKLINKKTGADIRDIGAAPERGTKVTVAPTIKMGGDAVGLMKGIADLTKAEQEMLKSAQTSKVLINEAAASNNSQTWEAARTQIAKAVGEGKLSNEDIRRTGVDPRLVQGALDWVNKKTVGVPNQDIMKQLYVVSDLLEKQATARINNTMGQARTLATDVSGVSPQAAETIFPMVGGGRGQGNTVNWNDLK